MIIPKNKVEEYSAPRAYKYFFISAKHAGAQEDAVILLDSLESLEAYGCHYNFDKREYYDCTGDETCPFCKSDNYMKVKYFIPVHFPNRGGVSFFPMSPTEKEMYLDQNFETDKPVSFTVRITRNTRDAEYAYSIYIISRPIDRTVVEYLAENNIDPKAIEVNLLSTEVTPTTPPVTSSYVAPPAPPSSAKPITAPAPAPAPEPVKPEPIVKPEPTVKPELPVEKDSKEIVPTPEIISLPDPVSPTDSNYDFIVEE